MVGDGSGVPRVIEGFTRESEDAVVLHLHCGHDRHVRHRPPMEVHEWATDDDRCRERVGQSIECLRCTQRLLPEGAEAYRRTPSFDEHSTPAGLRRDHSTKQGVWGRVIVEEGELRLEFGPPVSATVDGRPGAPIVIPPAVVHYVRLTGRVRFHVEFLRCSPAPG
ncbi:MAG: DUF3565 domain-containing protein [Myxococcota bacterium]